VFKLVITWARPTSCLSYWACERISVPHNHHQGHVVGEEADGDDDAFTDDRAGQGAGVVPGPVSAGLDQTLAPGSRLLSAATNLK